ncbi:MAG TPA: SMI1/KNR4 family protein [Pseudobacteroides sp.]|jgi:hypothetical protein|nr:SMI1/KNR4 family protein [Pseudobacteroides sp.]
MIDLTKIQNLILNDPASDFEINKVEKELKMQLPKAYRELLKLSNGFSIGGGLLIYGTMDISERNLTLGVKEYAKGYVAIGDDGAGNVFLMTQDLESKDVIVVDSGDMNPNNALKVTSDFTSWISSGCVNESAINNAPQILPDICDLVLVNPLNGGTKDLLQIKNVIGIEMPIGELLKGTKNLPFVLVKGFPYGKAKKLIEKLGTIGKAITLVPTELNKQ